MKIAVVNNTVPFLRGGAEILAEALVRELERAGHRTELIRLPFAWEPVERIFDAMLAAELTVIENVDRVIPLKFPAYLVPHADTVPWLLHQFRQFYDLWNTPAGYSEADAAVATVRGLVLRADVESLSRCRRRFVNSRVTQGRLETYSGLTSEVLLPPLPEPGLFHDDGLGDYIYAGGRINSFKRQLLAVRAMAHTTSDVRLVVAGMPETSADLDAIEQARERSGKADRITIIPQYVPDDVKADLVNNALACAYFPIDEDSYGYVTLEGAQARKALVTTSDSGGVTDLVIDGRSGRVVEPHPEEVARAFDELARSRSFAREMGAGAYEVAAELGLSWEHVVDVLTRDWSA